MLKNFRDKIALSGIAVLVIGVALLIFTFMSAYGFLTESLSIIASADLVQTFGEALAPLIATCIRIMYLGVMGWIGSLLTIRGVTIIAHTPKIPKVVPRKQVVAKPIRQKEKVEKPKEEVKPQEPKAERPEAEKPQEEAKPEEEVKPTEPEVIFMPPEQAPQPQPPQKQPQENNFSQQPTNS
jgi:hypothetical protein